MTSSVWKPHGRGKATAQGRSVVVLCNLKPRNMRGVKSNGMVRSRAPRCAICLLSGNLLCKCYLHMLCSLWLYLLDVRFSGRLQNDHAASRLENRTHVHAGPLCHSMWCGNWCMHLYGRWLA